MDSIEGQCWIQETSLIALSCQNFKHIDFVFFSFCNRMLLYLLLLLPFLIVVFIAFLLLYFFCFYYQISFKFCWFIFSSSSSVINPKKAKSVMSHKNEWSNLQFILLKNNVNRRLRDCTYMLHLYQIYSWMLSQTKNCTCNILYHAIYIYIYIYIYIWYTYIYIYIHMIIIYITYI